MAGSACDRVALTVQLGSGWAGNDGNWSTFGIAVGTPPQNFSVLPSITDGEVWVPVAEGCVKTTAAQACAASRGVSAINGTQSTGFQANASTTWHQLGIFQLDSGNDLYTQDDNNGLYGEDTVTLGQGTGEGFQIPNEIVAGIATPDFWLGSIGLNTAQSQFTGVEGVFPSVLSSMKALNLTPSLSFGYSAGASYRSVEGSLVFGGYDQALFDATQEPITYRMNNTHGGPLEVQLQSVVMTNTLNGTIALPIETGGVSLALDSSTSQLWLPQAYCDTLASAFGLTYDNSTGLYLIDNTTRTQLINSNPQFTFTLLSDDGDTTNLVFPFAAFDLQAGSGIYTTDTAYFPIRRAANQSQYVLGRTFLQEAYLVVDWDRSNFTIGQNSHQSGLPSQLTTICPTSSGSSRPSLSGGAVAGIVVGSIAAFVAVVALGALWWLRRKKRASQSHPAELAANSMSELEGPDKERAELMSSQIHEMQEPDTQLMSTPIYELPGDLHELPDHSHHDGAPVTNDKKA